MAAWRSPDRTSVPRAETFTAGRFLRDTVEGRFRADILDHPDDITLRLIYADWLEDNGRELQAAFTREPFGGGPVPVGIRTKEYRRLMALVSATLPDMGRGRPYLAEGKDLRAGRTLSDLLAGTFWMARPDDVCLVVRHGFVTEVGCGTRWFLRHGPGLLALHPVRDVRLMTSPGDPDDHDYGRCWWRNPPAGRAWGSLDRRLFDLLPGGIPYTHRGRHVVVYPDAHAAYRAASAACVAWARGS